MKKTEMERDADKRAKKAISKIELMKLKRQQKAYKAPESSSMSIATKIIIIVAIVLGIVVYMKQHSPEETKFSFVDAKAYCMEQGKLLPLTLDDDPEHLLNLYALEGKAYWSAEGKLLYNMDLGHQSYPKDAKHYVVCVDENGKTAATPIGTTAYK
jgi:hypothetical protein